jgi:hypothetical protein
MESIPVPSTLHTLYALYLFLVLGAAGSPVVSLGLEIYGHKTRTIFAVKLAQQMDRLGITLVLLILAAGTAANLLLLPDSPYLPALLRFLTPELTLLLSIPSLLLITFWTARALTWNRMKKRRPLHISLGVMTVLCMIALVVALAAMKRHLFTHELSVIGPVAIPELFSWPADGLIWPALIHFLIVGMGVAALLTPLYLFLRRTREDYGRDYYNWAMGVVAKWALIFMLGQLILLPWYYYSTSAVFQADLFPVIGAGIVSLFLAAGIWFLLIRSKTPMRYKGFVLLSVLLSWASLLAILMTALGLLSPQLF